MKVSGNVELVDMLETTQLERRPERMLNFELTVEGIQKDGHPILELFSSLDVAAARFDELEKFYPFNKVILSGLVKNVLKESKPKEKPLPSCPKGCIGKIDGKPNIVKGSRGQPYCKICGWMGLAT